MPEAFGPREGYEGAEKRSLQGGQGDREAQRVMEQRINAVVPTEPIVADAKLASSEEAAQAVRTEIARQPETPEERDAMTKRRIEQRILNS